MGFICRCGNTEFEKAMRPATEPLQPGVTPPAATYYERCNKPACKLLKSQALELKHQCPSCKGESFKNIGPTEVGTIIAGKTYPHTRVMIVECLRCGEKNGEDYLAEQAIIRAHDEGFVWS